MRRYRPTRNLFAEIERVLRASRPSFHRSPLDEVIDLLCQGRNYTWLGIYLTTEGSRHPQLVDARGDMHPGELALSGTRSKILVSMKLGSRELGVLAAESNVENAFAGEDRVLLEKVAARLARFLTGPGQYIARKARGAESGAGSRKSVAAEKR